ncbi:MAG: gliding motility-associated C-terminal domain-containing protein [Bacteroidales bacterium]|nr:gliding motility-associated C-terminal domain-containing protein [Bacteroidales bacterium]
MRKEKEKREKTLAQVVRGGCLSFLLFHFSFCQAQEPVAAVTGWLATVDSATQQIVLRWNASADSAVVGYHICAGSSDTGCFDYGTVLGRLDTSYICVDHSPLEQHHYRLHAFDSADNVSELTPFFGNVVLTAEVPDCGTTVSAHWNPYEGYWPDSVLGQPNSYIQTRMEPFDTSFIIQQGYTNSVTGNWSAEIPESVTRIWLRVMLLSNRGFRAYSNIVMVERHTTDTASVVAISDITYDSVHTAIDLTFEVDTAFEYTLYRSVDGTPWRQVYSFHPHHSPYRYSDNSINPYDSLHCYQLEVKDACGMNPLYSTTAWVVVPDPPLPFITIPNAIVAGDDLNGTFLPKIQGLRGDLYELFIYNRMGMLVYHTTDQDAGWTPSPSTPQGAYAYFLRCRYNTNDTKTYAGTVIVIK